MAKGKTTKVVKEVIKKVIAKKPEQLELEGFSNIRVVFDGQGNKTVFCVINGVGYTYPTEVEVEVPHNVAKVIGNFTIIKGE